MSSNQKTLVPIDGAYENLVVSSVGLKRFNLRGSSSSSSRAGVRLLGCVISFSRYLMLKLIISALTVGICKSARRSVFGTYHGAEDQIPYTLPYDPNPFFGSFNKISQTLLAIRRSQFAVQWHS